MIHLFISSLLEDVSVIEDSILAALQMYKRHLSIHKVKEMSFYFLHEDRNKILAIPQNINRKKATQEPDIPIRIIKGKQIYFFSVSISNVSLLHC